MLILSVLVSFCVAVYVLRKIWQLWRRGKVVQKRAEEEALLQEASSGRRGKSGQSELERR